LWTERVNGAATEGGCGRGGQGVLYPEVDMAPALLLASAGNTAFFVIFGIFVVAIIALAVIVIMWAVRHDLAGRQAWRARQEARVQGQQPDPPGTAPGAP
jgi:hypothetical protein